MSKLTYLKDMTSYDVKKHILELASSMRGKKTYLRKASEKLIKEYTKVYYKKAEKEHIIAPERIEDLVQDILKL